jgi:hypothetical protein
MIYKINIIEMFKLKRLKAPIYIVFITLMNLMWSNNVKLYAMRAEEVQLLAEYDVYTNIFSKEEAIKFSNFMCVKHAISIKEDVEVLYSSIYSLSMNELRVLYEYIKSSLKKGWIHHLESFIDVLILFVLKKNDGLHLYMNYKGLN